MQLIQVLLMVAGLLCKIEAYKIVYQENNNQVPLYVYDFIDFNVRCLSHELPGPTQMSEQTCMVLDDVDRLIQDYTRLLISAFHRFDRIEEIKKVLMIGLGGGVMLMPLQELCTEAILDVVEINPSIVNV